MSRWTPEQLAALRARARDAVVALVESLPKGQVRGLDRLRLLGAVAGAGAALAVACLLWERAVAIAARGEAG